MPAYDSALFAPPAPLAKVTLRDPRSATSLGDVLMLIDTGADVTLIPQGAIEKLGVPADLGEGYELIGFDGSVSVSRAVRVELLFLRRTFRGQFLIISEPYGVLGRNVVNHLCLTLDGPHLEWRESR